MNRRIQNLERRLAYLEWRVCSLEDDLHQEKGYSPLDKMINKLTARIDETNQNHPE